MCGEKVKQAVEYLKLWKLPFPFNSPSADQNGGENSGENKNVSQIGLSTHNQEHEIKPATFNNTSTRVKATTGSIPDRPDRLDFFSIYISPRKFDLLY